MSNWDDYRLTDIITEILSDVPLYQGETHHLGRPFLTAYQIAIRVVQDYPEVNAQLNLPIGGKDTGEHNSLAQYLARELSRRIRDNVITNIEGGFLSDQDLNISFVYNNAVISPSHGPRSIFRFRDEHAR